MIQYQRQQEILARLERHPSMSVRRLAQELFTSESTIRRDLDELAQQGRVRRVYGGVVLAKHTTVDWPAFHREQENIAKKQAIAAKAARVVQDGMSIFLDAATTVSLLVPYLAAHRDLTVVTNSLLLTQKLGELGEDTVRVFCTGGRYLPQNKAFGGSAALGMLQTVHADLLFFSARGITADGEITDTAEDENAVRRTMLARAKTRLFLCDDEKIGKQYLFKLCGRGDYDAIVCNAPLPEPLRDLEWS